MEPTRIAVAVTTDASGAAEVFTPTVTGRVLQVRYVPDGTSPLDTGADLDIVCETSGVVVSNHDDIGTSAFTRAYRQATHDAAGAEALYAASGEAVLDYVWAVGERLKLTIANGGNVKSGTFHIYVG